MAIRSFVVFEAGPAGKVDSPRPYGLEFASTLIERLRHQGFDFRTLSNHEDYAWSIYGAFGEKEFDLLLGHTGDAGGEWLLTCEPSAGLRVWPFGRKQSEDDPSWLELCRLIDASLRVDAKVRSIRWYTKEGFDADPDEHWAETPDA